MESLKLSFEAIMPVFLMIALGYTIKRLSIADKNGFDTINKLVFKFFLPLLLFYNIYKTEAIEVFDLKLVIFTLAGVFFVFVTGYIAAILLSKDNSRRGVMLQGFFRANFAILGIPLINHICGEGSGLITSLMIAVVIPVFNVLAVVALECFRKGSNKINIPGLLKGTITNPLIIGCIAGLVFFIFKIKLPSFLENTVSDIASTATPLSLIVLGTVFEFKATKGYLKEIIAVVSARLVLIPMIILPVAVRMGFSGEALACLLIIFGAPVAVSSFAMAQQMNGDEMLAAQLVAISSALCLLTLFVWIFILSYLNLF